jgi:hypothetical protein
LLPRIHVTPSDSVNTSIPASRLNAGMASLSAMSATLRYPPLPYRASCEACKSVVSNGTTGASTFVPLMLAMLKTP